MILDNLIFNQFLFLASIVIGLALSIWVYSAKKTEGTNRFFFGMVLLWLIGELTPYYIFRNFSLPKEILYFLPKIEIAFVFLFFILFYFFTTNFFNETKKFPILNKLIIIIASLGAGLAVLTNIFQKEVLLEGGKGSDIILTFEGKIFWLGFVVIMTLFILSRFLINYFRETKHNRLKIQYFLMGISLWIAFNLVLNVYFPIFRNTFKYAYFANYSILFLFGFTAVAIVKSQLFGIRIVLTELLVGAIALTLLVQIFTNPSIEWKFLNGIIFILFLAFGYYLIRAVINEARRREEAEKLAVDLKRLDETKTQFMLATQHHLRTPLTAIQGYLSMIYEGSYGKINDLAKSKVQRALEAAQKLITIVDEFLDVAQYTVGKELFGKKEVNIEDLIQEVIDELKPDVEGAGLYLKLEKSAENRHRVKVDPKEIREAIYNVINNAVKYTPQGGITVNVEKRKNSVLVKIKDTGIGLAKDEIGKLFERAFERGEDAKRIYTTGRGIGLYLASQIIKAHMGKIWAESAGKNKGSVFYIELPFSA